ncbi:MAG: hypothetical protein ACE5K4_07590 [Candidatus Hydrothermarchaeota archaeon]
MLELIKYILIFICAGSLVTGATYFGAKIQDPFYAAMIIFLPLITMTTVFFTYISTSNPELAISILYPNCFIAFIPWLGYVGFVVISYRCIGVLTSLLGGLGVYIIIMLILRNFLVS